MGESVPGDAERTEGKLPDGRWPTGPVLPRLRPDAGGETDPPPLPEGRWPTGPVLPRQPPDLGPRTSTPGDEVDRPFPARRWPTGPVLPQIRPEIGPGPPRPRSEAGSETETSEIPDDRWPTGPVLPRPRPGEEDPAATANRGDPSGRSTGTVLPRPRPIRPAELQGRVAPAPREAGSRFRRVLATSLVLGGAGMLAVLALVLGRETPAGDGVGASARVGAATPRVREPRTTPAPPTPKPALSDPPPIDPPSPPRPGRADALLRALGRDLAGFRIEGDELVWGDGLPVVDVRSGDPVLATSIGKLQVDRQLLGSASPAVFSRLFEAARAGGLSVAPSRPAELELADDHLLGLHLRSPGRLVLPEGVLLRTNEVPPSRSADVRRLDEAIATFRTEAARAPLDDLGRTVLLDLAGRLSGSVEDGDPDEATPAFVRRLVRHGWLRRIDAAARLASTRGLEEGVAACERLDAGDALQGSGGVLMRLCDAFGRDAWLLRTAERTIWSAPAPLPRHHSRARRSLSEARLLVRFPVGADPVGDLAAWDHIQEIRLLDGPTPLVEWSPGHGFRADEAGWRVAVPETPGKNLLDDFVPPHVVVVDPRGDVRRLVTARGDLVPARDESDAEVERFLADAARTLADPAHLDLIGEHLFQYVFDSPDTAQPSLVGTRGCHGDIHQTARETVLTTAGGVCRGDCDDLSELYVEIAGRQGRLAHVVHVPGHAVAAWAAPDGEGWRTVVLQTGPALEFAAPTLPESLSRAYGAFGPGERVDPDDLRVLLRFAGENTRHDFRLGWRIFADAGYARTMIDVQEDWHFHTYLQGIETMRRLLGSPAEDADASNHKEIASLYEVTGQFDLAIESRRKALERSSGAPARLRRTIDLLDTLALGGRTEEARALAEEIVSTSLPAVARESGSARIAGTVLDLADTLLGCGLPDVASKSVARFVQPTIDRVVRRLAETTRTPGFQRADWRHDPAIEGLLSTWSSTSLSILEKGGPIDPATGETLRTWFDHVAMYAAGEPTEAASVYARLAELAAIRLGAAEIESRIAGAPFPGNADHDHWRRTGGDEQLAADLPWMRVSVEYWYGRLQDEFGEDRTVLDRPRLERLATHLDRALSESRRLGTVTPDVETAHTLGRLLAATGTGDAATLRMVLRHVRDKNDADLRVHCATALGRVARLLPLDAFEAVIQVWRDEIDYKANWFEIAWTAACDAKAPRHALLVAKRAAERWKDDPSFVAEYEFMTKRYPE